MISYNNHNNIKEIHYNNHSIKYVYGCGGNLVWSGDTPTPPTPSGYTNQPLTLVFEGDGTFKLNKSLQYSLDSGSSWTTLAAYTNSPTINTNQKVMLRREQVTVDDDSGTITASTFFHAEGNAYSMLYGENFSGQTELPQVHNRLKNLFKGCVGLSNIDNLVLPATTFPIGDSYYSMFSGCTSLTTVPTDLLPATTLSIGCYSAMFADCTSLTNVPNLPATVLTDGCYQIMFKNCRNLTTIPSDLLPATSLTEKCYNGMFQGCSGLTTAPDLPALILVKTCYATMFFNCSNLNYIKCLARNIDAEDCTQMWTGMISSTGTFVKNPLMSSWTTGVDGIPDGWTVVDA